MRAGSTSDARSETVTHLAATTPSLSRTAHTPSAVPGPLACVLDQLARLERDAGATAFLARLLAARLSLVFDLPYLSGARFARISGAGSRPLGQSPDADYWSARIPHARSSEIGGSIPNGCCFAELGIYAAGGALLGARDLLEHADRRGRFRIVVPPSPSAPTDPETLPAHEAIVRYYFPAAPAAYLPPQVAAAAPLSTLDALIAAQQQVFTSAVALPLEATLQLRALAASLPEAQLVPLGGATPYAPQDAVYWAARCAPGRRLRLRGRLPAARFFGLSLHDDWLEPLAGEATHRNQAQITSSLDGVFDVQIVAESTGANTLRCDPERPSLLVVRALGAQERDLVLSLTSETP